MAKTDELVMAVPTAALFARGYFQGVKCGGAAWLDFIFAPENSRFLPRSQAETDPAWKQIIPYVILACDDQVFCYRRGKQSTETRLVALHSVGLGGHIRHDDENIFVTPGWNAYQAALERELAEEVSIAASVADDRLVGLINDDSTPVGQVHLGVIHIRRLASPDVRPRESQIAGGHWAALDSLLAPSGPKLETWSELALAAWPRLISICSSAERTPAEAAPPSQRKTAPTAR
jgi:predicted NUDIX family phosphoesterase